MRVILFYSSIRKIGPEKEKKKADMLSPVKVYGGLSGPGLWLFLENAIVPVPLESVSLVSLLSSNKHPLCLSEIKLVLYYLQPTSPISQWKYRDRMSLCVGMCVCMCVCAHVRLRVCSGSSVTSGLPCSHYLSPGPF